MPMPKTLKFVLKGDMPDKSEFFVMDDGSEVEVSKRKRLTVPSKKNQQRVMVKKITSSSGEESYRGYLIPSAQYQKWYAEQLPRFKEFVDHAARQGISLPISRAKIKVLFYFSDAIDKDLSNKFETIADIMQDVGLIFGDTFKVLKPVVLDGWVQRANPRTEIYLSILNPQDSPKEYEWDLTPPEYYEALRSKNNLKKRLKRKAISVRK